MAATVVTETRRALFALVEEAANGNSLSRLFRSPTLEVVPANVWLYWRAQDKLNELQSAIGPLLTSMKHDRLAAPAHRQREPDVVRAQLKETCPLRTMQRRHKPDKRGRIREIVDSHPEQLCRRACDLLLLFELCLRLEEMEKAMDLDTSTIQKELKFCGARLNDKRTKADAPGATANRAPANPH